MPGSIKIDDGSGNYTILTNAGSLGSDKTITIPNETATLATTTATNLGGLVKLHSVTASNSSSVDFLFSDTGWTRSAYHSFIIKGRGITSVSDAVRLYGAFYSNSSLRSGTYQVAHYYKSSTTSDNGYAQDNDTDFIDFLDGTIGTDTREGCQLNVEVFPSGDSTSSSTIPTFFHSNLSAKYNGGQIYNVKSDGTFDSTSHINGMKFYMSSGNISTGEFDFYGVKR